MGRPKKIITETVKSDKLPDNNQNIIIDPTVALTQSTSSVDVTVPVKSKRGRKSNKLKPLQCVVVESNKLDNNIICEINEVNNTSNDNIVISNAYDVNYQDNMDNMDNMDNLDKTINITTLSNDSIEEKIPLKKRGRKPKGGKIIQQIIPSLNLKETKPNIILHLKCSLKDLNNNLFSNNLNNLNGFNFGNKTDLTYDIISSNISSDLNTYQPFEINQTLSQIQQPKQNYNLIDELINDNLDDSTQHCKENKENDIKEIWKKLKGLENNLHINNISDKKSACFWCTCDFDTPCIYIPKHFIKESYHVYGCFCTPECATAYLMEENIDTSCKFERYHLLNHIYSKIYDYKKNIKPAPNPFYMLDKYYGNLSIQEYRSLLKSERLFLVVDKPLTRILPELHEDNDDFIINNKIIPSNTYQIKKKLMNKNLTKTNILNEKFGMTVHQ
jgi:hypothetical protein